MKTYKVTFVGRTLNAIGVCYRISDTVKGIDEKDALINLYSKYENVSLAVFTEIISPKFVTVVTTHYGMTREEYAAKAGKHYSCFDNRERPLCANGSYHAKTTRVIAKVDCPVCLAKLKGD